MGEALTPAFKQYARQIIDNAKALAEVLSAGGLRLVSGGTDNHLMLADVTPLGLSGRQAEEALGRCRITVNKNMIPFDPRKPMDPSGIRIGTPALTTPRHEVRRNADHRRLDSRSPPRGGRREDDRAVGRARVARCAGSFPSPGLDEQRSRLPPEGGPYVFLQDS